MEPKLFIRRTELEERIYYKLENITRLNNEIDKIGDFIKERDELRDSLHLDIKKLQEWGEIKDA